MKKFLIFILALCMVLPLAACGNSGEKPTGGDDSTPANIKAWAFHSYEKTVVNVGPTGDFSTDYTVYLAKGETEGCQVAIYSETEFKNVTFGMASGETELVKPAMFSMDRAHKIVRKEYTDSLIPYYGKRLQLKKNRVLPFMIEFTTTKDTPAGEYKYVYELKDKDKNVLATYNITVHVWDITLPEEKTFVTAVEITKPFIQHFKGIYEDWYNTVLDHNMCAYDLPYDILDQRANEYMSNPRVTSFRVTIPMKEDKSIDKDKLLAIYNKLLTNEEWLKKAFFYPIDEPKNREELDKLREWERILTKLCPKIEICAPIYTNIKVGEGKDQTEEMSEYTDLWCPKLCLWDDVKSYGDFLDYTPNKTYAERIAEQQAKGDRVWSYVCNDPDDPYAQLFIDTEGVNQRLMFWQIYQRNIGGFLYWSVSWYGYKEGSNPWASGDTATMQNPWDTTNTKVTNGEGKTIYGCGFLFYPGIEVGYGGAVPSIRAKIIRDGVDDVELFYLAEQHLDKDWIIEKTKEGTPSLTQYTSNDKFAALRIEIGNALEAALKK